MRPNNMWRELREKHGQYIQLDNMTRIFEDGTEVRGDDYLMIQEPPADEIGQLRARRNYLVAKLNQEVEDFKKFKSECAAQANLHERSPRICPPPHPQSVEMLEAGKERIVLLRMAIIEIDEQLPESQRQQKREDDARRDADRNRKQEQAIRSVQI